MTDDASGKVPVTFAKACLRELNACLPELSAD